MKNISENTELERAITYSCSLLQIMQIVTSLCNDIIILVKIKEKVTLPSACHDGL